jgi:hypothetical protein
MLAGFTHAEIDTLIALLTRLAIAAEGKPREGRGSLLTNVQPVPKIALPLKAAARAPKGKKS